MNVLLTGCSKGLGIEATRVLLENGFSVFGISRTETIELSELKSKYQGKLFNLIYDLEDTNEVKKRILTNLLEKILSMHLLIMPQLLTMILYQIFKLSLLRKCIE